MTINSANLKLEVEQASKKLDACAFSLKKRFEAVESNSLSSGMTDEEKKAFMFFKGLVETDITTIEEVKNVFALCITAHEGHKAEIKAMREEYKEAVKFQKFFKVLLSGKAVVITLICSGLLAATKYYGGE